VGFILGGVVSLAAAYLNDRYGDRVPY